MQLKLISALDCGFPAKQRLVFRVLQPGNLIGFSVRIAEREIYRFPDFEVNRKDMIIVYSKRGYQSTQEFHDVTCHFFYADRYGSLPDNIKHYEISNLSGYD